MFAFALSLALAIAPCSPTEDVVLVGDHFELICHFQNPAAAEQALRSAEATWVRAQELYGPIELVDGQKLKVHLYRNAAEYETAEMGLTQGRFKRNQAFAHFDSMSAHVAIQPPLSDGAIEVFGLPAQTLRLLAHECAHIARFSHMQNFRSHPNWLADGAASWIDEKVSTDLGLFTQLEADPKFCADILSVQNLLKNGALPTVEAILNDQVEALGWGERYHVRWMLFRFLQEKSNKDLIALLGEARRLGGGSDFTKKLYAEFVTHFGKAKVAKMDVAFHKYVNSFKPEWDEVYRALAFIAGNWKQAAFNTNAIAWRTKPVHKKKYSVKGQLTVLPGPRQQMNLFLGRCDEGFFSVAFTANNGITLFEFLSEGDQWVQRGYAKCPALKLGEAFAFEVNVNKDAIEVSVGGSLVIAGRAETVDLAGPWGLCAQAQSAGIWVLESAPGL